jgi:hypothetical protein
MDLKCGGIAHIIAKLIITGTGWFRLMSFAHLTTSRASSENQTVAWTDEKMIRISGVSAL